MCFCFQTCWCSIVIFSFVTERTNILHTFEYLIPEHRIKIERTIPANIRLGKDVLETSWRRLQDVFNETFFCLPRRLEDIIARCLANTSWRRLEAWRHNCKTSYKHVLKTSWRRFRKTYCKYVLKNSWRHLQEVLEDEKCYAEDVFKTSWRRLKNKKCLLG